MGSDSFNRRFCVRFVPILLAAWTISGTVQPISCAQAVDRDVRAVLVAGEYGLASGTILGLATLPFSQDFRTVFIGSSVGLYLGIAVGFYYVFHRDDPDNPLRSHPQGRQNDWPEDARFDPDDRGRELRKIAGKLEIGPSGLAGNEQEPIRLSVPVLRF